ncbi:nitroreductase family deazaflavin-dependent oxidoreductase [Actinocorallia populi]|uniref:nitroreductase family deazaflavin-dependent oxidoreductase n=1 Tax=Actinocorallia populi TaxID=2079200 RepID=UPI000D08E36B|nr:nitroreductase family deazaflavin-dependent oxidoreductase [Actinocorallia populi]
MSAQSPLIQRVFGPVFQKVAGARWFRRLGPGVVPKLDQMLHRVTGGRLMLSQLLVPTLYLTTVGAKSGQERITPLLCMPEGDGWIVVGSNFGRDRHPAWTGNLLKAPEATVEYEKKTYKVIGTLLEGGERAEIWTRLNEIWPVYTKYQAEVDRELRVFRLSPC